MMDSIEQHVLHDTSRPSSASQIPDLTGQVTLQDRFAAAHGGFADVYIGLWQSSEGSKPLKVSPTLDNEIVAIA